MNATAIASARLIGEILVDEGLITEEQLEQALDEQQATEQRLGEVLIARFGVSRIELSSALSRQLAEHERSSVADGDSAPGGNSVEQRPIGTSEKDLVRALRLQRETGGRLGDILLDNGVLSGVKLESALSEQLASLETHRPTSARPDEPSADASAQLVGEARDLRAALDRLQGRLERAQAAAGERLGQVEQRLAEAVTPAQLNERVDSLTSAMLELGRLSEEIAGRLTQRTADGIETVAGAVESLRAELDDHGHEELVAVGEQIAGLELRLASAATSAELDERLERALAPRLAEIGRELDALKHGSEHVASAADLTRLKTAIDLLSDVTDSANDHASRRLAQLEARSEEAAAAEERLQAALIEIADRSTAADDRLREAIVEASDRTELLLSDERNDRRERLGRDVQELQLASSESLSSFRVSIEELTAQLAEQRRQLEVQTRAEIARVDGQLVQQEARAEEHAVHASRAADLLEQQVQQLESELRGRLERHSDRIDEQLRKLEEVRDAGAQALQAASARLTQRLSDVERHAVTATRDLKEDLGQLGEKVAGQAVEAAQESAAAHAELDRLRSRIDDLTSGLERHENGAVENTANAQRELDGVRAEIGALTDRLDVQQELAAKLREEATLALTSLREEAAERERLILEKVVEGELERRKGDAVLETRIDGLGEQLASEAANAADVAAAESEALRGGLDLIAGRLDEVDLRLQGMDEGANAAINRIERDLGDVAVRSAAQAAELQRDLRAELAKTTDSHSVLISRVEQLARTQAVRLTRAEETLGSLGVDELRAQVAELQSQVDAQSRQARAQANAVEQLRDAFVELNSKLFERQQTFQAAGAELMSTFEELGHTIRTVDDEPGQAPPKSDEGQTAGKQTFLAFTPDDDNRYSMVECAGEQPEIGARFKPAGIGGDALVVTRVTDSPLPHDKRRCIYLERLS